MKFFEPELAEYYDPVKDNKVAVITGGNQGIGWFTVLHLYLHGFKVYMLGRNPEKCLKAIKDIKKEAEVRVAKYTDNGTNRPVGDIKHIKCDLMDLKSVENAANEYTQQETKLDILINNAGIMAAPFEMTKDDYEIQYQVNVASHVLLTFKLLPLLEKVDKPRVIHLSSLAHTSVTKYENSDRFVKGTPAVYYNFRRYGIAKLESIHFMKALAEKHPKILCISLHPGVIITQLYDPTYASFSIFGPIVKGMIKCSNVFIGVSTEIGSYATLRAALDTSLSAEHDNGVYLTTGGPVATPTKAASNLGYARSTWDWNVKQLKQRGYDFDT